MAKITYSALVTRIRGSLGGTTFANWKGIEVLKTRVFRPRNERSDKQQMIRGITAWLSGQWFVFAEQTKDMWDQYGSLLPKRMSGFNAFLKLNIPLVYYQMLKAETPAPEFNPPTGVSTPEVISDFEVAEALGVSTLTWEAQTAVADKMIAEFSFMTGRDDSSSPRWSYAQQALATTGTMAFTHGLPLGTPIRYRLKVIDSVGRQSPPSITVLTTATVPAP